GDDAVAEAWALALDGSARLAALPGHADQLLLRLRTKLNDVAWWRQRQAADPWDAGHLIAGEAAARHLQQHFQPRRATLLIAGAVDAQQLAHSIDALQQRSKTFRFPVRLLCLAGAPLAPDRVRSITRLVPPN
ncbi:hypothetical protein, partial [Aquabacterium sp.]|uniref:hypothetical protein n=1 Tax=Aquabacterium sp. TaxID=1872578 RepID=UPI002CE16C82